jgi:hypothetical protein
MRAKTILTFALFLAVRAASQVAPQPPRQAQCKFSDGSAITVTYSLEHKDYLLRTDGDIVTVGGVRVPPGDYTSSPARDSRGNWTFTMKKPVMNRGYWMLPAFHMSVTAASPLLTEGFPVSFDQTGGSCMMRWNPRKSDTLLSLEFTEKNADMPVLQ